MPNPEYEVSVCDDGYGMYVELYNDHNGDDCIVMADHLGHMIGKLVELNRKRKAGQLKVKNC